VGERASIVVVIGEQKMPVRERVMMSSVLVYVFRRQSGRHGEPQCQRADSQ
jgi:hypothetical protein